MFENKKAITVFNSLKVWVEIEDWGYDHGRIESTEYWGRKCNWFDEL